MRARVLVVGVGPLPFEATRSNPAVGIRSWQLADAASRSGAQVDLVLMPAPGAYGEHTPRAVEERSGVRIRRLPLGSFDDWRAVAAAAGGQAHDAVIGATIHGAFAAARAVVRGGATPFWADQFGHAMAEAQVKAHSDEEDRVLRYFRRRVRRVSAIADRFSVVSRSQLFACVGELGLLGRLNRHTFGERLVEVVPCPVVDTESLRPSESDPDQQAEFVVLWSGSFNAWSDVETLFTGVDGAMRRDPRIRFRCTGGEVPGQSTGAYRRFASLVAASDQRERFEMLGWVDPAKLQSVLTGSDLGLVVEHQSYEGELGSKNRLLEWATCGLPILCNPIGDFPAELTRRGGALSFTAGSGEELADRLVWAAGNRDALQQQACRARERVLQSYRMEDTTSAVVAWCSSPCRAGDAALVRRRSLLASLADWAEALRRGLAATSRPS